MNRKQPTEAKQENAQVEGLETAVSPTVTPLLEATESNQDQATALIAQAIEKNVPVETMEKLLAMRRELRAEKAKEEFDRAMARFQRACPTIEKRKQGYNYKYADLTDIVEQVKDLLADNGFSYSFDTDEAENGTIIYCKVKHIGGHTEMSKDKIDKEKQTKMNASQQSGATMTYGKRYAFVNAFGILTGDEDTDASTSTRNSNVRHVPDVVKSQIIDDYETVTQIDEPQVIEASTLPITTAQKTQIMVLLGKKKKTMTDLQSYLETRFNKESHQDLTSEEANITIKKLESL